MSQTSQTDVSSLTDLITQWQQINPQPASLERMHNACRSLSATLTGIAADSLFDTEPELLQTTLDELAGNQSEQAGTKS